MGILDDAAATAAELDALERDLSRREALWADEEEVEQRDLRASQQRRRVARRLGVDVEAVTVERFPSQVAFLVDDLVLAEERATEKYVDENGSRREVEVHHCFVLGASKGNPFAPPGSDVGKHLQVSGFRLRDRSDLVGVLRTSGDTLFDRDAVLALLADGARMRTARRPW